MIVMTCNRGCGEVQPSRVPLQVADLSEETPRETIWTSNVISGTPLWPPRIKHTRLWNESAAPAQYRCGMCPGILHSHWQCDLTVTTGSWNSSVHMATVPCTGLGVLTVLGYKISQNLTWWRSPFLLWAIWDLVNLHNLVRDGHLGLFYIHAKSPENTKNSFKNQNK